jgi:hypothetical protein
MEIKKIIGVILVILAVISLIGSVLFVAPALLLFGDAANVLQQGTDEQLQELGIDQTLRPAGETMSQIIIIGWIWLATTIIAALAGLYCGLQFARGKM